MTLPMPDLDDRRFDDLVAELQARLQNQLPELNQLAPGDPAYALVDMFAWLAETVIYRANRIPERQHRAFLNLLQMPVRPARPARGLVSIDTKYERTELVKDETRLKAGQVDFTTVGEVVATPLALHVVVKERLDGKALSAQGISNDQLTSLTQRYGATPDPFRPKTLEVGRDPLTTLGSVDNALYLALSLIKGQMDAKIHEALAGTVINLGLAPLDILSDEAAAELKPRKLKWDLAWWPSSDEMDEVTYLPLELINDSSRGGRQSGVARLRLPSDAALINLPKELDPMYAGGGRTPPEPPAQIKPGRQFCWLRLGCDDDRLDLAYIAINAVEVLGQGVVRNTLVGVGSGQPDQAIQLPHTTIDAETLKIEVEAQRQFKRWQRVEHFSGCGAEDRVFVIEPSSGSLRFGSGQQGFRPPKHARIRVVEYRHGGGSQGNLPAGSISQVAAGNGGIKLRHEWPTHGGIDAETVAEAERRIPAYINHRNRAVTAEDFAVLARDNPLRPIARAECKAGFFPGTQLNAVRRNVPGVVSVFVMPPAAPALAAAPQPTAGIIRDLFDYLAARTLVGTELYVLSPQFRPISVAISLEVTDPRQQLAVFQAVEQALIHYLWALPVDNQSGWPLGRSVEINELRTHAGRVAGVEAVNALRLFYQDLDNALWHELVNDQALSLTDYQLPELMAVAIELGEETPAPPRGYASGDQPSPTPPTPVPVIPDIC